MKYLYTSMFIMLSILILSSNRLPFDYEKAWKEVEKLMNEDFLPQSALKEVDLIYKQALNEQAYEQVLKALVTKTTLQSILDEDSPGIVPDKLKQEVELLPFPAKAVGYSLIADAYWQYYRMNRWKFYSRTNMNVIPEDINTWTTEILAKEIIKYYLLSVEQGKDLQKEPIRKYLPMMTRVDEQDSEKWRPTLYDFLMGRAIEAFSQGELSNISPVESFQLDRKDYFADIEQFTKFKPEIIDEQSANYQVIRLYQEWLLYLKGGNKTNAVIDADLNRLKFVRHNSTLSNKEDLYEIALKQLADAYPDNQTTGDVLYQLAYLYFHQGKSFRSGKPEYRNHFVKAITIAQNIKEKYPQSSAAQSYCEQLIQSINKSTLSLVAEDYLSPNITNKAFIEYSNLEKVYLSIFRIGLMNYMELNNRGDDAARRKLANDSLLVSQKEIVLARKNDYQKYSVEFPIDPLSQGYYILVISTKEDLSDIGNILEAKSIQVSNISLFTQSINWDDSGILNIRNRTTGTPVEGASVKVYTSNNYASPLEKLVRTYTSNKEGIVTLKEENETKRISGMLIEKGKDQLFQSYPNFYKYNYHSTKDPKVVFFTDRAIYRPGQTVYFKALLLDQNEDTPKILPYFNFNTEFLDVNYQQITSLSLKTNEFGTASGSFTIPQGRLNGQMRISSFSDNKYFKVEEYKRPSFEVKINAPTQEISLNTNITLSGEAKAYTGSPVDFAQVNYRIVRRNFFPYYFWGYYPMNNNQKEIASGKLTTDKLGNFKIDLNTLAEDLSNDKLIYNYIVTADITDNNGETQSASYTLLASQKPLLIKTDIPQKLREQDSLIFNLSTTNLNGEEVDSDLHIEIAELLGPNKLRRKSLWQQPDTFIMDRAKFEKLFPLDTYSGEENNPTKFEIKRIVEQKKQTTKQSTKLDLGTLAKYKADWYRIRITAKSQKGVQVENDYYVEYSSQNKAIHKMEDWLQAVKIKARVGEKLEFWLAGAPNALIQYSIINLDKKTVLNSSVKTGPIPFKLLIPVKEEYKSGFVVQFNLIQDNRLYAASFPIEIPKDDKKLNITFNTFRDQLLPGDNEKWSITIKDLHGDAQLAELLTSMYDASLDVFTKNVWPDMSEIYPVGQLNVRINSSNLNSIHNKLIYNYSYDNVNYFVRRYPELTLDLTYPRGKSILAAPIASRSASAEKLQLQESAVSADLAMSGGGVEEKNETKEKEYSGKPEEESEEGSLENIPVRSNFNETAFFYPQLRTDEQGNVVVEFTVPEALTRWRILGFAHTKDLKIGTINKELITKKEVSIFANAPRFLREGDKIVFTAKINNLTETKLDIASILRIFDPVSGKEVENILQTEAKQNGLVDGQASTVVSWTLLVPEGLQALTYRITAQGGAHTDGEEKTIPVLSNKMLVTESMPFMVRGGQTKDFKFERLQNSKSSTLRNHSLTLEFTSNPAWYAVQSLPYMIEYPYQCSEQIFSRFYANSLASSLVSRSPRIKQVFDLWKTLPDSKALQSQLEKNQELKQALLEETPWVLDAQSETEQKKRIGLLFDLNRMNNELENSLLKLQDMQDGEGGFPWFEGLRPNRYITQHLVSGFAHIRNLNAVPDKYQTTIDNMVEKAFVYLDAEILRDYKNHIKYKADLNKMQLTNIHLHYFYTCAYYKHKPKNKDEQEAYNYFYKQAIQYWSQFPLYQQALIALAMHADSNHELANKIVRSLKERAIQSEELGMYWKDNKAGYFWYQAPIETQALLIEVFNEIAKDSKSVEDMKIWLLRNKQTSNWRTTKATANAVYALFSTEGHKTDFSLIEDTKILDVTLGGKNLKDRKPNLQAEAGTGYVKTNWQGGEVEKSMADIQVKNENKGIAWGAMYWQYFENLDKITAAETNLKIKRELFLKTNTSRGPVLSPISSGEVKVGDLLTVRMELRADRDFEYVHLKDARAASLEPVSTSSGYRFKNALFYYENIKDASMNFFIDYLPKGTYVFEYDLRVSHKGDFSNGISTFQSMYAPEFSAHSEGIRLEIK